MPPPHLVVDKASVILVENLSSGVPVVQGVVGGALSIGASSIEPVVNADAHGTGLTVIGSYANQLTVSVVTPTSIQGMIQAGVLQEEQVISQAYDVLLGSEGVFPVNEGLGATRITATIAAMRQYKILTGTAPVESALVSTSPIAAAVSKLGVCTGDPRWN